MTRRIDSWGTLGNTDSVGSSGIGPTQPPITGVAIVCGGPQAMPATELACPIPINARVLRILAE